MGLELDPLSRRAFPFTRRRDELIGNERERLRLILDDPGRCSLSHARRLVFLAPGSHHRPALRNLGHHSIGTERADNIGVPLAFTAQVHAFRTDMPRGLTGGHESQVARFPWRIVDLAMIIHDHGHLPVTVFWKGDHNALYRRLRKTYGRERDDFGRASLPTRGGMCSHCDGLDMQRLCKHKRDRCDVWLGLQVNLIGGGQLVCRGDQLD